MNRTIGVAVATVLVTLGVAVGSSAQLEGTPESSPKATSSWSCASPQSPVTYVTNPTGLGLNINNVSGATYHDYAIDGGGDSSVLLQGSTTNVTLSRFHITRTDANPTVSWAAHAIYVKAYGNTFNDIYADNSGGHGTSGLSVRMRNNTFNRTCISGYTHAVTYYEHDGNAGTVSFTDGTWHFTGDTAVWGDDSNEPPTPYIKQTFVFDGINASGPGAYFLKFGNSAYVSGALAYQGAGVTIHNCTLNGQPVTAAMVSGVPTSKLHIS